MATIEWVTTTAASRTSGIPKRTIIAAINRGDLPAQKLPGLTGGNPSFSDVNQAIEEGAGGQNNGLAVEFPAILADDARNLPATYLKGAGSTFDIAPTDFTAWSAGRQIKAAS